MLDASPEVVAASCEREQSVSPDSVLTRAIEHAMRNRPVTLPGYWKNGQLRLTKHSCDVGWLR